MIKSIYIKDYAIIDRTRLEFVDGFTVFIGETGAGKSIIVGAINLLIGGRADSSFIRQGQDKAEVEGIFTIDDRMGAILDEAEIEHDDEIIVYRKIQNDAKSTIRVNDRAVTLNFLQKLFKTTVDIHSQKDSQFLLKAQNHRLLLDLYLDDKELLKEVNDSYARYIENKRLYEGYLKMNDSESDIEYYRYQIKEIEDAKLDLNEEEELLRKEKLYKDHKIYLDHLERALALYNAEDGIASRLYEAQKELDFDDDEIKEIKEKINDDYYELEDLFERLKDFLRKIDISEEEIDIVQERLFMINKLKRKYRKEISDILKLKNDLKERIEAYENRQAILDEYERAIKSSYDAYLEKADILSSKRKNAAKALKRDIVKEMDGLELRFFDLDVIFKNKEASSDGIDDIEFYISTNKGEAPKPLIKIASGGEISRILLGLKALFTKASGIRLAIFDEIDTGVSGKAAFAIGEKMSKISKDTQVIAITHLAQVAAFADETCFVFKSEDAVHTTSSISHLEDDKLIQELAMMASSDITNSSKEVARELLARAREIKNASK